MLAAARGQRAPRRRPRAARSRRRRRRSSGSAAGPRTRPRRAPGRPAPPAPRCCTASGTSGAGGSCGAHGRAGEGQRQHERGEPARPAGASGGCCRVTRRVLLAEAQHALGAVVVDQHRAGRVEGEGARPAQLRARQARERLALRVEDQDAELLVGDVDVAERRRRPRRPASSARPGRRCAAACRSRPSTRTVLSSRSSVTMPPSASTSMRVTLRFAASFGGKVPSVLALARRSAAPSPGPRRTPARDRRA